MSGGLFTNQLLRETAVEIDPERVERLQRAHARAYQQYSVQIPLAGARKLLAWLTEIRIPWAIATSGRMETAAANLATLNVDPRKRCDNHARSGQARKAGSGSVPGRSRPSRCPHRKGDCGRGQYLRYARGNALPGVGDRTAQRRIQFR
jgi:phosphoglycolate phosphatase-like HAD superfamily hydrolase